MADEKLVGEMCRVFAQEVGTWSGIKHPCITELLGGMVEPQLCIVLAPCVDRS